MITVLAGEHSLRAITFCTHNIMNTLGLYISFSPPPALSSRLCYGELETRPHYFKVSPGGNLGAKCRDTLMPNREGEKGREDASPWETAQTRHREDCDILLKTYLLKGSQSSVTDRATP